MKKIFVTLLAAILLLICNNPVTIAANNLSIMQGNKSYTAGNSSPALGKYSFSVEGQGNNYVLSDKESGIKAEVSKQTLNEGAFELLRNYYNDSSLSEEELFRRFLELKKSYINALQTLYNPNYLSVEPGSPETAMRVFHEGSDVLYGINNCSVYLYNISVYEGLKHEELTHLDLLIPVKATNTIISVKFTIPRENLGDAALNITAAMLESLQFEGLSPQVTPPQVLFDNSMVKAAESGIYPAESQESPDYTVYVNTDVGFSIPLPVTYVPFVKNSLGGIFTYSSYKINPNIIFSVSSEPLNITGSSDIFNRSWIMANNTFKIKGSGTTKLGNNNFSYITYSSSEKQTEQYFYDYYIKDDQRIYRLQLQSKLAEPGSNVREQFYRILEGFHSISIPSINDTAAVKTYPYTNKYTNSEEGYSFNYPVNWRLEDVSPNISYDRLRLVAPGLSGALDISVQESFLKPFVTFNDILKSTTDTNISSWTTLTEKYNPPFANKKSRLLYFDYSKQGPNEIIYRLSSFIDENGRNRLCYSVDIINGRKIYSMFITAGEYKTSEGKFSDNLVNELINTVASSFHMEKTQQSEARRLSNETRSRKIIYVEEYLKRIIDPELVAASVENNLSDGSFFVTVDNTEHDKKGYYRIKLDYTGRQIFLMDRVLERSILQSELIRLLEMYKGKTVTKSVTNEDNMTIIIESRENEFSPKVTRTYRVNVTFENDNIAWNSTRLAYPEDLMWECEQFADSLFPGDASVYFSEDGVFKDLEPYINKEVNYRFMVYAKTKNTAGFQVISMNPRSSLFTAIGDLISLDKMVKKIKMKTGYNYISAPGKDYDFDPETFILTLPAYDNNNNQDGTGNSGNTNYPGGKNADTNKNTAVEHFKIYYHADNGIIDFKKLD